MPKIFWLLSLLAGIIYGCICSHLAKKKGKNPVWWFAMGMACGIFAPIFLFFLPPTKKPNPPILQSELFNTEELKILWYYVEENRQQCGPVTIKGLLNAFKDGKLSESSYVWNEKMENWQMISHLPIKEKFTNSFGNG
jgi:hypothetical protein